MKRHGIGPYFARLLIDLGTQTTFIKPIEDPTHLSTTLQESASFNPKLLVSGHAPIPCFGKRNAIRERCVDDEGFPTGVDTSFGVPQADGELRGEACFCH